MCLLAVNPTIELFIEQLQISADALEDYGISVVMVSRKYMHRSFICIFKYIILVHNG